MAMRNFLTLAISVLVLTGCEERTDVPLSTQESELLVVEAVITNENRNHLVKLSRPHSEHNGLRNAVSGAAVYVLEDTVVRPLVEFPAGSGNYYTPVMRGLFGKMYTLYIQHEGRSYFAQDSAVPVQPMDELDFRHTDNGYTLTPAPHGQDPNYIEHFVTWRHTTECAPGESCEGRLFFYDLKTIDVNELYKPDKEPFYFPRLSVVVRRKYSVSPAYKAFLRAMMSETQWRGGLFDVQRSNVTTNLSAGAIGFFAVCSVVSDTTLVQ
jgi:hypothetical protein